MRTHVHCSKRVAREGAAAGEAGAARGAQAGSTARPAPAEQPPAANIVRTHDIDQDGNLHFIVMDYVDGAEPPRRGEASSGRWTSAGR